MISKMDDIMTSLNTEKDQLLENIEMQEVKIKRSPKLRDDTNLRQTVLDNISEEKWVIVPWLMTRNFFEKAFDEIFRDLRFLWWVLQMKKKRSSFLTKSSTRSWNDYRLSVVVSFAVYGHVAG